MFQIGPSLREARTRRGLSAADVHKAVRIRERYLTAIEEERWEMLPGDAYTKGFLRTYAEFLGLNGQLYVDEYNARIAQHDDEPLVPEALKQRRGASRILFRTIGAVLVVGALVAGLAAWRHSSPAARPTIQDASAAVEQPAAKPVRRAAPRATAMPQASSQEAAKPVVAPKATFTVIRAAHDRSWLSVRIGGPSGREVFRGTLEQGRFLKFGLGHGIWVRMGRPLALDIRIGSHRVGGLPASASNLLLTQNGPRAG